MMQSEMLAPRTSSQLADEAQKRIGINSDYAEENFNLFLNIIHLLERRIE